MLVIKTTKFKNVDFDIGNNDYLMLTEMQTTYSDYNLEIPNLNVSGTLWAWGDNTYGQLGQGDTTPRSSPIQVGIETSWKSISIAAYGNSVGVINNKGFLFAWGDNTYGQLGAQDRNHRSYPQGIGAITDFWNQLSFNESTSYAIKTDGTLWAWGRNSNGELGNGVNILPRSSPGQIGSLTNWKQISGGGAAALAVKTDGTLWGWGANGSGQLGLGNTLNRSSPTQVGALTDWQYVAGGFYHAAAIKTDGTLWTWGFNTYGQLGHNDRTSRSSPVQVGTLTNWKQVSVGKNHTLAIKTDGTLWGWGRNDWGQLGIGLSGAAHRSSPVQIGTLTNWKTVDCGENVVAAIKIDGTLWTWGYNNNGQLGYGYLQSMSSPVQVSALSKWKQVSASSYFMIGQKK